MSLRAWLNDVVTVEKEGGGRTGDGDVAASGVKVEVRARVEEFVSMLRDADGLERQSAYRVATEERIGLRDRVWVPGRNTLKADQALTPITVESAASKDGRRLKFYMTTLG